MAASALAACGTLGVLWPGMSTSPKTRDHDITRLLAACREGDKEAEADLFNRVYRQLRGMAQHQMALERPGHTLQTTALVHEVYLRLFGTEIDWQDRAHFFAVAAQMMRRVLVDHARLRRASKRSGGVRVELGDAGVMSDHNLDNVLAVDQALSRLAERDGRQAKIVEIHLFAGLNLEETARVLGISARTAQRDWNFALAWLYGQMQSCR